MASETLRPDGELSDSGLVTNSELDHDEDPDVSSVTVNATGNNVNTEWGGGFPTPTSNPTVGADLQEFRVGVEEFDSGQTGTPQARIELWENGTLVRAGSNTNVSTYAVLNFLWNANELATADGSLVQCKLIGTKSGGSPGARNTVRIGHIEWNAEVDGAGPVTGDGSSDGVATALGDGVSTAAADGSSSGIATASGDGTSTVVADGTSSGVAVATAVGQEAGTIVTGVGATDGASTVIGDGVSIAVSDGVSTSVATTVGDGISTAAGDGSLSGIATVTAIGISTVVAIGIAAGLSTVIAVGQDVGGGGIVTGDGISASVASVTGDGVTRLNTIAKICIFISVSN